MKRYVVIWILVLIACNLTMQPTPPLPTPSLPPLTTTATRWTPIQEGIEQQFYSAAGTPAYFQTIRIDPTLYVFRAHYTPGTPHTLAEWREMLPGAVVIVNANFFTPDHNVLGLLISDGVRYGDPYVNRGGMFTVQNGTPVIRSNTQEPYRGEALEQAVQAFPMLVQDGTAAYTNTSQNRSARRTVIGMDAAGRVILMATPALGMGLYDMSEWLPTTDLNLQDAFNLDGGGSVMLYAGDAVAIPPFDPVPAVLAAYPRN